MWYGPLPTTKSRAKLRLLFPVLKSLSQMELTNGSLDLATMDFTRNRVTFEQQAVLKGDLDLAGLKNALTANPITVLYAPVFGDPRHYGDFFVKEITQRLNVGTPNELGESRPLRVLVIVSGRMELGVGLQPTIAPPTGG